MIAEDTHRATLRSVVPPNDLFARRAEVGVRDVLIEHYLPLAHGLARRYLHSGQPLDDLVQVASIGLLHAVDRYDPELGSRFEAFAIPTILGELKRYHRDHGWSVRVPRRLQERSLMIRTLTPLIAQDLGRSPTIPEIASQTHLTTDQVIEAMDAQDSYSSISLDALSDPQNEGSSLGAQLATEVAEFGIAEEWAQLAPRLRTLPERECKIIVLRFFKDWTQSEIARELGISQMHVSRLLSRALRKLRSSAPDVEADSLVGAH